ncbi:PiggyBac_transposable element-derived protein [Hexamita inflata]|uniref:PiggyBac transposable element-derived protein n=1 Tax=Hexamita inflata TaxID=28002 RepID=A0AA86Q922_9EUKA|nr:PiggyBac transposable element-derived protein [Hexamita inflata]
MSEKIPEVVVSPHQQRAYELFMKHFNRDLLVSIACDTTNFMVWRYGVGETMALDELYRMLSIMLTMCVHSNANIRNHWSNLQLLQNPFIKETMPVDQFLQYQYNLRFCDAKSTNVPTEEEAALGNDEDGDQSTKHEEYLSYSTKYEKEKKIVPTLIRLQTFSRKLQDIWKQAVCSIYNNAINMQLSMYGCQYQHQKCSTIILAFLTKLYLSLCVKGKNL